jgi:hypothetical protein
MGKKGDGGAGAARAQAQANLEKAIQDIEALQIPDIEKQKLQLKLMSEAGFLEAEQLGPSALEDISLDPRLRQAEMSALSELQERGQAGFTDEDRMMRDMMLRGVAEQEQAAQKAVLGGMAERGMLDSGAQLAAQLGTQQSGFRNARDEADRIAMAQLQARRDALSQSANLAGNMASRDFGQQVQVGSAKDVINQFNLQNRQNIAAQNLGIRQQDIGLQNQQQMYNKELLQQQFENQKGVTAMKANARIGQATQQQQQADALARAHASKGSGLGTALGMAAGAMAGSAGGPMGMMKGASMGAGIGNMAGQSFGFKDGGCVTKRAEDGSLLYESSGMGDVVPGDSYAGDRVDARINSGEMVLNVPQQQRLMDVIRGEEDLTALEDGDIVEGVPKSYSDKLHRKSDKKAKGFKRLLDMLGE